MKCIDCGAHVYNHRRCESCQAKFKKQYQALYWSDKPASATRYYQYYKFAIGLTDDEITYLIGKKKRELKYVTGEEHKKIRTLIKILCDIYDYRKLEREERRRNGYIEDNERTSIVNDGIEDETEND